MSGGLNIRVERMQYPGSRDGVLVEDLSLAVPAGQFISILGPSGSGKTTLLRIVAGIERRFDGRVLLDGAEIAAPTRRIQLVFQDARLLPWMSVSDNVGFALDGDDSERDARIAASLSSLGLAGKGGQLPKTLSGGEQGRAALARALIGSPEVLLLDEPFRNVDLKVRYDLLEKLQRALQESPRTVLLVSHCIEDAVLLSDAVYVFESSPLSKPTVFDVSLPRPRQPDDPAVAELTRSVVHHVLRKKI